jgi:hypothetical protein
VQQAGDVRGVGRRRLSNLYLWFVHVPIFPPQRSSRCLRLGRRAGALGANR